MPLARRRTAIVALLALVASVLSLVATTAPSDAEVVDGGRIPPASGDGFANFRTFCDFSHAAYDDPIVYPGEPGAAHLHFFFGNTSVDAFSTPADLRTSGRSTCQGGWRNRSAYWMPAVITATGAPVIPDGTNIYYKHLNDEPDADVVPLPKGLVIVAGNADGSAEDAPGPVATWFCEGGQASDTIPTCPQGSYLSMTVLFPPCWDGERLDSEDHQSHMAYAQFDGQGRQLCPASHPVAVPGIILSFDWQVRETSTAGWHLSSDMGRPAGSTLHADWMNGWRQSTMRTWVRNCINKVLDCTAGELGDGRALANTVPFGSREVPKPIAHAGMPAPEGPFCNGRPATIVGTPGDDVITGTPGDDVIVAKGGDDVIDGGDGYDIICAGSGNDVLRGGPGNDELYGGAGDDDLQGGDGDDHAFGGNGADVIEETDGDGFDSLRGGFGPDRLVVLGGENLHLGGHGDDVILGGWWVDRMYGGAGDDTITGKIDYDRIWGNRGIDTCSNAGRIRSCE